MDVKDVLTIIIFALLVVLVVVAVTLFADMVIPSEYHVETMSITGIEKHDMIYKYTLDGRHLVDSVNYYNLTDKLNVTINRGKISGLTKGNIFINGVVV